MSTYRGCLRHILTTTTTVRTSRPPTTTPPTTATIITIIVQLSSSPAHRPVIPACCKGAFTWDALRCAAAFAGLIKYIGIRCECSQWTRCGAVRHAAPFCRIDYCKTPHRTASLQRVQCEHSHRIPMYLISPANAATQRTASGVNEP